MIDVLLTKWEELVRRYGDPDIDVDIGEMYTYANTFAGKYKLLTNETTEYVTYVIRVHESECLDDSLHFIRGTGITAKDKRAARHAAVEESYEGEPVEFDPENEPEVQLLAILKGSPKVLKIFDQ